MAHITFATLDGQDFVVPERIDGDGPDITITICRSGEFIDPSKDELAFMPKPPQPFIERVELAGGPRQKASVAMADIWHPTEAELQMAKDEAARLRNPPTEELTPIQKMIRDFYG